MATSSATVSRRDSPVLWSLEALVDEEHQHLKSYARIDFILDSIASRGTTLVRTMNLLQLKARELVKEGVSKVYSDESKEYVSRDFAPYITIAAAMQNKAAFILDECPPEVRATEDWKEASRTYYLNALAFSNLLGRNRWSGPIPPVLNYA